MENKKIGVRIKITREKLELTQKRMAKKLHLCQSIIADYEKGKKACSVITLRKIAMLSNYPQSTLWFLLCMEKMPAVKGKAQ